MIALLAGGLLLLEVQYQSELQYHITLWTDHYFYRGRGGGGVTIFGTCRQFFLKNNAFQTLFSLHCVMKTILYDHFKNVTGFFIDFI